MASDRSESSLLWAEKGSSGSRDGARERGDVSTRVLAEGEAPIPVAESATAPKIKRLIADQRCFGLEALAFREGAERLLARIAAQDQPGVDVRSVRTDFLLDDAGSWTLLRTLLVAGLLQPDGTGRYRPTARFNDYARACVVAPLSRARAKRLIERAVSVAARINAGWTQNPYQIQEIAVAGSYMSRSDPLPELSLWLVLQKRAETRALRRKASPAHDHAVHQIVAAMRALSSFIVLRVARDRQGVQRPFILVFEAEEETSARPVPTWERVREWGASIGRRLAPR